MKRLKYLLNRIGRVFFKQRVDPPWLEEGTTQFLIFNPTWPDPPRKWFQTLEQARQQADFLAKKQPYDTFYILKAVQVLTCVPTVKELPGGEP